MCVLTQHSLVETLTPKAQVVGGQVFAMSLCHRGTAGGRGYTRPWRAGVVQREVNTSLKSPFQFHRDVIWHEALSGAERRQGPRA